MRQSIAKDKQNPSTSNPSIPPLQDSVAPSTHNPLPKVSFALSSKASPFTPHNPLPTVSFDLSPNVQQSTPHREFITNTENFTNKYPNFVRGETLNPATPKPHFLDPLQPPVVKLSLLSGESEDQRYLLGRLSTQRIFDDVKLYLAYLHKQPDNVCVDGKTRLSTLVSIRKEGFPTEVSKLKALYVRFHEHYGQSPQQIEFDLSTFGTHIHSRYIAYLQRCRENHNKFFRS